MIRFSFNIGCFESKVILKRRKKKKQTCQIKMLYREQTFSPRAFHSELQQQTNSQHSRLEPAIRDAQKLAQNVFPPWSRRHIGKREDPGDEVDCVIVAFSSPEPLSLIPNHVTKKRRALRTTMCFSGRKNVLRKLLRILIAGSRRAFLTVFDCVCLSLRVLTKTDWNAQGLNVFSSKSLFTLVWFLFFVA